MRYNKHSSSKTCFSSYNATFWQTVTYMFYEDDRYFQSSHALHETGRHHLLCT